MEVLQTYLSDPFVKYYISAFAALYPLAVIFARAGFSRLRALWVLVPFAGYLVVAGLLALSRWPVMPRAEHPAAKDAADG